MASKLQNLRQASKTGPRRALIAPKSFLVGLVTQSDWIDVLTVFILIIFEFFGNSKLNYLSFDQNHLIKNPILFCKYLTPQKLHRNGFVFKILVWIWIFKRKNNFNVWYLVADILSKVGGSIFWYTLYLPAIHQSFMVFL